MCDPCFPLLQLERALKSIRNEEKVDYLEAIRRCPDLVASESDPMRFLRFTHFNTSAAAQGLIRYWKRRRKVFGEKAFLPMLLTGNGALSEEVIESVKSGQLVVLPPDRYGRTVRCVDQSRLIERRPAIRSQSSFYNAQLLSEEPGSQSKGLVMLVLLHNAEKLDKVAVENQTAWLSAFPVKVNECHFFDFVPRWEKTNFQSIMNHIMIHFQKLAPNVHIFTHPKSDKESLLKTLECHGLERTGVPESLGGEWTFEHDFAKWLNRRGCHDMQRFLSCSPTHAIETHVVSTNAAAAPPRCNDGSLLFVQNWQSQVEKALRALPPKETAAYRAALEEVPLEANKEEVNYNSFLRTEYFNPVLAAKRLARYWQLRASTFGPRKFLPMHQTGEGALGRKEVKMLGQGFLQLLPGDSSGRPVLWIEPARLAGCPNKTKIETRDRCLFYMFSILTEDAKSRSDGCVFLYRMENPAFSELGDEFLERVAFALPLRTKRMHFLTTDASVPPDITSKISFADQGVLLHKADTTAELRSMLEASGLKRTGLPRSLHGEWGYEKFVSWLEVRTRMEFQIPQNLFTKANGDAFDFPGIRHYKLLPEEEKDEQSRRLNVIHCKRKRSRSRIMVAAMEEDSKYLQEQQDMLKNENERLQSILDSAVTLVSSLKDLEEDVSAANTLKLLSGSSSSELKEKFSTGASSHIRSDGKCAQSMLDDESRLLFPRPRNSTDDKDQQVAKLPIIDTGSDETALVLISERNDSQDCLCKQSVRDVLENDRQRMYEQLVQKALKSIEK